MPQRAVLQRGITILQHDNLPLGLEASLKQVHLDDARVDVVRDAAVGAEAVEE